MNNRLLDVAYTIAVWLFVAMAYIVVAALIFAEN